jgi:hypothetical protein
MIGTLPVDGFVDAVPCAIVTVDTELLTDPDMVEEADCKV